MILPISASSCFISLVPEPKHTSGTDLPEVPGGRPSSHTRLSFRLSTPARLGQARTSTASPAFSNWPERRGRRCPCTPEDVHPEGAEIAEKERNEPQGISCCCRGACAATFLEGTRRQLPGPPHLRPTCHSEPQRPL